MKNDTPFEDLITKAGTHAELSDATRAQMRSTLSAHVAAHPLPTASPYQRYFAFTLESLRRPVLALAAFILVIGVGTGGIAYAAEGTLPGDTLYPVKVAIVEPLQIALISSPAAKAAFQAGLAERRITEAATLANEGRLATSTQASLAVAFAKHAQAASSTPAEGIFAARLAAYEEVLADIQNKPGASQTGILRGVIKAQIAFDTPASSTAEPTRATATFKAPAPAVMHASFMSAVAPVQESTTSSATSSENAVIPQEAVSSDDALKAAARLEVLGHAAIEFNIDPFATTTSTSSKWIREGREQ